MQGESQDDRRQVGATAATSGPLPPRGMGWRGTSPITMRRAPLPQPLPTRGRGGALLHRLACGLTVTLSPLPALAETAGWGGVGKAADKGFSWTAPLWPEFWMAWTPATFALFLGIFGAMAVLTVLEIRRPGGDERMGVLGLVTTRGDRLFITLLGTSYIFLAWLGLVGMPLWWPLGLAILWGGFAFWKV